MFSDLVGSTALSARMDPEDLREIISAFRSALPLLSLQRAERMPEQKDLGRYGRPPSLPRYIATMLAQQVIALQTELHRPKPL